MLQHTYVYCYYWATDCKYNTALSDKINSLKEGVYVLFSH